MLQAVQLIVSGTCGPYNKTLRVDMQFCTKGLAPQIYLHAYPGSILSFPQYAALMSLHFRVRCCKRVHRLPQLSIPDPALLDSNICITN